MIVQARIMSDTEATLHLPDGEQQLTAATLPELRAHVKQAFIDEARRRHESVDVQIVEPDRVHHLAVEPSGRIANRVPDDRPVFGPPTPAPGAPLVAADAGTQRAAGGSHAAPREDDADATRAIPRITDATEDPATAAVAPGPAAETDADAPAPEAPTDPTPGSGHRGRHSQPESTSAPEAEQAPARTTPADAKPETAPIIDRAPLFPRTPAPTSPDPAPVTAPVPAAGGTPAPSASFPSATPAPAADEEPAPAAVDGSVAATDAAPARDAHIAEGAPSAPAPEPTPTSSSPRSATASRSAARPVAAPAVSADGKPLPTLQDLRGGTRPLAAAPPTRGFPAFITRLTGGGITPRPNRAERRERAETERIRRPLEHPRNIVVVNLKGGAHKTTACLMIASTLGVARGASVLAWDNNETRGTLGWRGSQGENHHTVRDLLDDLETLGDGASASDLDRYVRHQDATRFDLLASDEDAGSAMLMDGPAFADLNEALSRFYRVKVIDTGNNVRASNWLAAVGAADQLVIISTVREDTFNAAAWMIDELRATGYADKVDHAVTILSHSSAKGIDKVLHKRLLSHFGAHTRVVHEVPFEKQFVDGGELDWSRVSRETKRAWLAATATIVDGL